MLLLLLRAGSPPLELLCCCVRPAQHTPHMWRSSSAQSVTKIARRQRNPTSFACTPDAIVRSCSAFRWLFGSRIHSHSLAFVVCVRRSLGRRSVVVGVRVCGVRRGGGDWGGLGGFLSIAQPVLMGARALNLALCCLEMRKRATGKTWFFFSRSSLFFHIIISLLS